MVIGKHPGHSNTTALAAGSCQARPHWPSPPRPGPHLPLPCSVPPALQRGLVCRKESYRLPVSPQQWGFSTNGGQRKLLSAFPIHLPKPLQKILEESLLWKQPLSQQISGVLQRGTLTSCRAELCSNLCSQTPEQPSASGHQVQCAFVTLSCLSLLLCTVLL